MKRFVSDSASSARNEEITVSNDPIRSLVEELAAMVPPGERIKLREAEIRLRQRWGGNIPHPSGTDRPGGCYTCRFVGVPRDPAVWCAFPDGEHLHSEADRGCAFWEREPAADP